MPNWVLNKFEVSGSPADINRLLTEVKGDESAFSFQKILPMPDTLRIVSGGSTNFCILAYALHPDTPQHIKREALAHGVENPLAKYGIGSTAPANGVPINELLPVIELYRKTKGQVGQDVVYDGSTSPDETFDSHAKFGKVYFENWKNYGTNDWYDWNVDRWGTKWDASDVEVGEPAISQSDPDSCSVHIEFQTAWSMPGGIFSELIKRHPELEFAGVYADEDIGSNCGVWGKSGGEFSAVPLSSNSRGDSIRFACEVWGYDPEEYFGDGDEEGGGADDAGESEKSASS